MSNFLSKEELKISNEFKKKGYVIRKIKDTKSLSKIRKLFVKSIKKNIQKKIKFKKEEDIFNFIHKKIETNRLNSFRLKIINDINKSKNIRELYYKISRPVLDVILGNELAMQLRINLSIQLPNDKSSLLPIHSDTWSGDSPFETVVWIPMVNCYKSKSMYIIKPEKIKLVNSLIKKNMSTDKLFLNIKKYVNWINIKYGQVLIFNQNLPHGNIVNEEKETRWSFNCRFKSLFSPYGDKKLGEFFEPIEIKPASKIGMIYKYPKV